MNASKRYLYSWSGQSTQGKPLTGEIEAISLNVAKAYLKQQGVIPRIITKKRKQWLRYFNQKISPLEIALFFRQFSTLITASIPLLQCCIILRETQENSLLQHLLTVLKNEIEAGRHFVSGLRKFPHYFDEMTCHLIHVGEQTGTLDTILKRIALYQEKSLHLKQQIQQALFYPCMVFVIALLVTSVMLMFVVPRFEELFHSMHGQLPSFTRAILTLSHFLRDYYWLSLFPLMIIIIFWHYAQSSIKIKNHFHQLILHIPFLNSFLKKIILARFARNLAITFSSGIPIPDALQIISQTTGNHEYTKAITTLRANIASGQQIHMAMQANALFSTLLVQMVKVGEESGTLELMLIKIADLYEADIDHLVIHLSRLLEPLIMVVLGALIGGLVIAMYLPIFKLGTII